MIEITEKESGLLLAEHVSGLICAFGAVGSDMETVIIFGEGHLEGKYFLATQDDLEHSKDGVFVQLKHPENPLPPEFEDVFTVVEF